MGRKKKYGTEEEKREAKRIQWNLWYSRNKDELNAKRMKRYYAEKLRK